MEAQPIISIEFVLGDEHQTPLEFYIQNKLLFIQFRVH